MAERRRVKSAAKAAQKTAIANRRRQVASLALAYVPQNQIAQQMGVSDATISDDLKQIKAGWLADAKQDVQIAAVRELESLDQLESRLWSQFVGADDPNVKTRTAAQILRCKERRAKMLGFDTPDLLSITISDERLQAEVIELREVLGYDEPVALPN